MDLFFGIVSLIISAFIIFIICKLQKEDDNILGAAVFGALSITFLIVSISLLDKYCSPRITPIDVYRGNTTLEITYRDSIAIDSVVVWKEEVK